MANAIYPKARQAFARGEIDWQADNIKVLLVDSTYVYSESQDFRDDVGGGSVVATSGNLSAKTSDLGIMDAADITIATVSGDTIVGVILFQDTGTPATSHLIAYWDSTAASVLISVAPDGTSIRVRWSNGPLKIFRL